MLEDVGAVYFEERCPFDRLKDARQAVKQQHMLIPVVRLERICSMISLCADDHKLREHVHFQTMGSFL